ncbi:hypothetical protein E1B28_002569 [Marasmius oreades]|uniref:Coilin n=1 Tax=Marasmius oreades TaxID=181124 RepID=A0A9P7UKW1_9AGAR|nr:uncharacterized protein E1B28_002569 [Marasmius oreades]KAG7086627.1 hypothetical protein E1B28_002569 [Marasmius oreades]
MRLRLESSPPLPHVKVWISSSQSQNKLSVHSSQNKPRPQSILDLKKKICTTIKPLSETGAGANDIILELDGFELLDNFPVDELIREGDIILIGAREGVATSTSQSCPEIGKKRKFNLNPSQASHSERTKKRQKRVSFSPFSSESSSDSSSSSESSSDSSSSESESDSSSESSSSSESDSESSESDTSSASSTTSPPSKVPTKPKLPSQKLLNGKFQKEDVSRTHVTPGQGSAQTRKRNLRRRLKQQYDAPAACGEELLPPLQTPKGLSEANQAPLGSREFVSTLNPSKNKQVASVNHEETRIGPDRVDPASTTPNLDASRNAELNLSMFSLGNKNKKKGFKKQALSFPKVMGKIVFSAAKHNEQLPQTPQLLNARDSGMNQETQDPVLPYLSEPVPQARPRLISPSEKQALGLLPRNVWVSSVNVEEGLAKAKRKKKKQSPQVTEGIDSYRAHGGGYVSCQREEEEVVDTLNYGDSVEKPVPVLDGEHDEDEAKSKLLWSIAERSFDSLPTITVQDKEVVVHTGVVVGWKALALNPITYSPDILLHLATVLSTSSISFSIRKIVRPGWEEYVEEEAQEEEIEWDRVVSDGWRIVKPK